MTPGGGGSGAFQFRDHLRTKISGQRPKLTASDRKPPPPGVATAGGVYIWSNGYVTCYTDEDGTRTRL
jgi:hypothetical protein